MAEEYICKTDFTNIAINCDDNNNTTQFTIVHELGHLFNFRAGGQASGSGSLFDQLDNPGNVKDYRSNAPERRIVFGYRTTATGDQDWDRGTRGWGSAAATPWSCLGSATNPSNFQQNPCNEAGTGSDEVEEAAADMLLNWVYRNQGDGGFLNCLWENLGSNLNICNDPDGDLRTGDVRFDWMKSAVGAIFTQRAW